MDNLLFKIEIQGVQEQVEKLGKLRDELARVKNEQTQLDKEFETGTVEAQRYHQESGILQAKLAALGKETSYVKQQVDSQVTSYKAAEGSMAQISRELGQMRERYRALSQAERENEQVGGVLLKNIQAKDTQIKKLDASIGNHQRNVGNYSSALSGLGSVISQNVPILGGLGNAFTSVKDGMGAMSEATGSTKTGILAIGGAIGLATAAFGGLTMVIKDTIDSSDTLSDKWEEMTTGMQFAYRSLLTTIASGDFSNFTTRMEEAIKLGKEYAQTLDLIENRTRSTTIRESENTLAVDKLRLALKNVNLTSEERQAIAVKIQALEKNISEEKKVTAEIELENELKKVRLATGLSDNIIKQYLKQQIAYSPLIQQAQDYLDLQDKLYMQSYNNKGQVVYVINPDVQKQIEETSAEVVAFASIVKKMGLAAPADVDAVVKKWVDLNNVTHEYNQSVEKVITTANKLDAQGDKTADRLLKSAEAAKAKLESQQASNANIIAQNNALILQLTQSAIDAQIMAMVDGKDREKAIIDNKFEDEKQQIELEAAERVRILNKAIEDTKEQKPKTPEDTQKQLADLKTLEEQKVKIVEIGNKLVEESKAAHLRKLKELDDKYNKTKEDAKVQTDYTQAVAKTQEEYNLKLDVSRKYYASLGTLTKEQTEQQQRDELKLALDLNQKKYDLLYAEIQARKELGTITQAEYDVQIQKIAELYAEVKKISGQIDEIKPSKTSKDKDQPDEITKMIMSISPELSESDAGKIKQQVGQLLGDLQNMWIQSQQQRIQMELKNETAKLDRNITAEHRALEIKRKKGLITEAQYEQEKEALDAKYEYAKLLLQKKAFEDQKELSILMAIMNGAVAFTNALTVQPFILGAILAALTAISVGVQIATIESQKFSGAKGGLLDGPSHDQGGIKYYSDNQDVELEGDEAVINKKSMKDDRVMTVTGTPKQIASSINELDGNGVRFAHGASVRRQYGGFIDRYRPSGITNFKPFVSGGYSPAPTSRATQQVSVANLSTEGIAASNKVIADSLTMAINDQRVYVVENDISEAQGKVKKLKVEASW